MATLLNRNRKDFPFTNPPLVAKEQQALQRFHRRELEDLHDHLQQQMTDAFDQLANKILELEERLEVLEL